MARTMQESSEGVFINVANLTLAHWDSFMDYLKASINQDTLSALRTAPLCSALFPDFKAEEEMHHHEDKHSAGPSHKKSQCFHDSTCNQQVEQFECRNGW